MNTPLTSRIQRLLVTPEKKEKLLAELEKLNDPQKDHLNGLLNEHDSKSLEILDEKVEEQDAVRNEAVSHLEHETPAIDTEKDAEVLLKVIQDIFSSAEAMAAFFSSADDKVIEAVQTLIIESAEDDKKEEFKAFFTEIRLKKTQFDHDDKEAYKAALIEDIQSKQEAIAEMDALIAENEKVLEQTPNPLRGE
ncbi:MAG: hypothetical protein P1V18_02640 [Candidatus Gracilibacteria bacterium]|nr:hypothetical protein [Candidatus Gracilibacteria bacterium]